ncbi:hypothetical protein [Paraburkholderia agricolaris]|jgi:hypothetical protein|uniref:hypothetical protein n=1 Tax=Paraburkholderia agricolaris TaxID=2152888 RepID=UPI0012910433|nr:hypothetical protein [Paraburkholderia agricolaris]
MSAYAYIDIEDVPANLRETSVERPDEISPEKTLIAFEGCPFAGEIWKRQRAHDGADATDVIFPFPRAVGPRNDLVAWFMNWGIHFRVVM